LKEITSSRHKFPKPHELYEAVNFWGPNILTAEGTAWQRHRKPIAPAFSERNNRFVWDESMRIVSEMFVSKPWRGRSVVEVKHIVDITLPMALFVIGVAGFGKRVGWDEDEVIPPDHKLSFKDALHTVATNIPLRIVLPKWAFQLRKAWRHAKLSFDELDLYMRELIQARRAATVKEERFDVFAGLMDATDDADDEKAQLTDTELVSNIFIFQAAGHETTAHTLAFTFGLLALYPDEQENLYQHITSIAADGRIPAYDEYNKFTYCIAVLYETMRLYPPGLFVVKQCAEDTFLPTSSGKGIAVPAGTPLVMNFCALHRNSNFWAEPNAFRPARFTEPDCPRDAFMPFSAGSRGCIGRRFFETEAIAFLVQIVAQYRIALVDDPEWAGIKDIELKREKALRPKLGATMAPARLPLRFTKR